MNKTLKLAVAAYGVAIAATTVVFLRQK